MEGGKGGGTRPYLIGPAVKQSNLMRDHSKVRFT